MRITAVYVFPCEGYDNLASRFANSFRANPPGEDHTLIVVINGCKPQDRHRGILDGIPCVFIEGDNQGWDIGAYQVIASEADSDMMVCFGSSSYFKKPGWMKRMSDVFKSHGPNLYGATGCLAPYPHVRTTAFWFPPNLLAAYPYEIVSYEDRYQFEHGHQNFTLFTLQNGLTAYIVYWNGMRFIYQCDGYPNGYHVGDQSELLAFDRCSEIHCA